MAEYQARGVVHFHAVIRLDAPGEDYQPPPPGIDAAMLCDAVRAAAAAVRIAQPDGTGTAITLASARRKAPTSGPSAATTWRAPASR